MESKNILLILIIVIGFNISCRTPYDNVYSIAVKNNSGSVIVTYISYLYPDTNIYADSIELGGINPGSIRFYDSDKPWNEVISKTPLDTISIFVFNIDTINQYGWEKVKSDYHILKRYDLSWDDIDKSNSLIEYP